MAKQKLEIWRDIITIGALLLYALFISWASFFIFEGIGYVALIPLIIFLFVFGWAFHYDLELRRRFYED